MCTGAECRICGVFTQQNFPRWTPQPLVIEIPPPPTYPRPSTTIIILSEATGHVLVHQRSDNQRWSFPGGMMEVGESILECCLREGKEETGFDLAIDRLVCIDSHSEHALCRYPDGNAVHYCNMTFTTHVLGGKLAMSDESLALQWVTLDALPEPFTPSHRWRLEQALMFTPARGVVIR